MGIETAVAMFVAFLLLGVYPGNPAIRAAMHRKLKALIGRAQELVGDEDENGQTANNIEK